MRKVTKIPPKRGENSAAAPVDIFPGGPYDYMREKLIWNRRLFCEWKIKKK